MEWDEESCKTLDIVPVEKTSERVKRGAKAAKKWQLVGKCGKIVSKTGRTRAFRQVWPIGPVDYWCGWSGGNNRQDAKSQKGLSSQHDQSDEYRVSFCRTGYRATAVLIWRVAVRKRASDEFQRWRSPGAVSVCVFEIVNLPGRFPSRTSAVRNGRYLTEESFHAKVR